MRPVRRCCVAGRLVPSVHRIERREAGSATPSYFIPIISFFDSVRNLVESPIIFSGTVQVAAKPNQIYKGLLAHLVSANDNGCQANSTLKHRKTELEF